MVHIPEDRSAPVPSCPAVTQAAINKAASEITAMSEMELFKGWLQVRQDRALRGMNTTTGDEFTGHAYVFTLFLDARQVVGMYEREARG